MTRFQRASWLAVLIVTLVAFGLLIPRLPEWGDQRIVLSTDTEVGMATASVTIPAGWDLEIAASSRRQPVASRDGVTVATVDALWFGDTASLLAQVSRLIFEGDAAIPENPVMGGAPAAEFPAADAPVADPPADDAPADGSAAREVWRLGPAADAGEGAPARVDVIREGQGVVLVIARGTTTDVAALSEELDAMTDSVQLDLSTLNVEVRG